MSDQRAAGAEPVRFQPVTESSNTATGDPGRALDGGPGPTGQDCVAAGRRGRRRMATEDEARALSSAVRLRILRLCLDRALTNKEIAARLDANPATTLHHVRTLVETGFLAPQPERRGARGAREVPYLATGRSWTLDVPRSGTSADNSAIVQAFLEEIRLIDIGEASLTRLGARLTATELAEVLDRLGTIVDEIARRPPSPTGRPVSLFLAVFPDPGRD